MRKGLGRVEHFDPRNLNYLISDVVPPSPVEAKLAIRASREQRGLRLAPTNLADRPYQYFYDAAWWGDQGSTPHCTAFALSHAMADGPITHKQNPLQDPHNLYDAIQRRDRAAGRHYDEGATSLAMADEARARGWIGEFRWGYSLSDFTAAIRVGPVLLGIDWMEGMDEPTADGVIRATGAVRGGHEIVCNGADFTAGKARLKQSWGRQWGKKGHAYLPFADLERLIADGGDVILFRELPTPKVAA